MLSHHRRPFVHVFQLSGLLYLRDIAISGDSVFLIHVCQEGDDVEVVPNSQFVVSRVATRSNKSEYEIDGRKANFTEVTSLLRSKGVDLDNNRFLILQVDDLKRAFHSSNNHQDLQTP